MVRTKQTRKKSSMAVSRRTKRITSVSSTISQKSSTSSVTDDSISSYQYLFTRKWESPAHFLDAYRKCCKEVLEQITSDWDYERRISELYKYQIEHVIPLELLNTRLTAQLDEQEFLKALDDPNVPKGEYEGKPTAPPGNTDFKMPQVPVKPNRQGARKRSISESLSSARKRSITRSSSTARSRSITRKPSVDRKRSASQTALDRFKTPLMTNQMMTPGSFITPKLSNTPMTMMRRPQMGEVPFSMDGSPLMVNAIASEEFPTVNVPIHGRIFSLIPQQGAPPPELPDLDDETRSYLKTLREHLEILAPKTPPGRITKKKL